jgi:hypothetical protein
MMWEAGNRLLHCQGLVPMWISRQESTCTVALRFQQDLWFWSCLILHAFFLRREYLAVWEIRIFLPLPPMTLSRRISLALCKSRTVFIWSWKRYIPKDRNFHNHRYANLKFCITIRDPLCFLIQSPSVNCASLRLVQHYTLCENHGVHKWIIHNFMYHVIFKHSKIMVTIVGNCSVQKTRHLHADIFVRTFLWGNRSADFYR